MDSSKDKKLKSELTRTSTKTYNSQIKSIPCETVMNNESKTKSEIPMSVGAISVAAISHLVDSQETDRSFDGHGEVGRLVDCSQAEDRRLIGLVRARRLLYARSDLPVASCHARVKALWQDVANEMGWSVAEVRRKWSHMRNSYSRHLRNEAASARTGRGRAVSRWYLAAELEFLREHMATDTRGSSFSTPTNQDAAPSSPIDVKPPIATSWASNPWPQSSTDFAPSGSEDSVGSTALVPEDSSSYFEFFNGLHAEYMALSLRRRRLFRRQCLQCLHELLDEQEQEVPSPTPSRSPAPTTIQGYTILPND